MRVCLSVLNCGTIASWAVWFGFQVSALAIAPADPVSFSPCDSPSCPRLAQIPNPNPNPDPNRDRFLQPLPKPPDKVPPPEPELRPEPPEEPRLSPDDRPFPVRAIEVTGSTLLTPDEIEAIVAPLENQTVTLSRLREAADAITEIYLRQGFITSRAVVPEQTVADGVVEIRVIEGSLEKIEVEGTRRLDPDYIIDRVRLGAKIPLSTASLENQLRLLRIDPLFESVEASLRAGTEEGQSILVVRVMEADAFQVSFSTDNYSPPSIGSQRLGVNLRHLNLTGRGDLLFASYNTTRLITGGESDVLDVLYSIPINAMNGTIQFRIPPYQNQVIQEDFEDLDIEGNSLQFEISYRQPLIRTPAEEFAVSAGFAYQTSQTFVDDEGLRFGFGPDDDGVTRTSVVKVGQDYIRRDPRGAWALRSQFSLGLGVLGATNTAFPPNGQFFSWLGQVQRVQRLGRNHLLIVQGDVQLSADPLFPAQQFVIGGALSLRGYRQNVRAGDNGFRFSVEDRITLSRDRSDLPNLQLAPFVDVGKVWNHPENPNELFGRTFLVGAGLGVLWEPVPNLNLRVDYGFPFIELADRGDNLQDDGLYFNVVYTID